MSRLFAGRVRCKGPATDYAEVELPVDRVLLLYRPRGGASPRLEFTQLYAANGHHVVAEARLGGTVPVCLIYTIEGAYATDSS